MSLAPIKTAGEKQAKRVGPPDQIFEPGRAPLDQKAWNPSYLAGARILNRPLTSSWDITSAVDDGFKATTWVYVCADKLARSVASVPWGAQRRVSGKANKWDEAADTELHELLQKPNEKQSISELMYRWTLGLLLGGNAIIHKTRGLGDRVAELWSIGPNGVKPIPDKEEFISTYEVTDGDGKKTIYAADDIIHDQMPDPESQYWGMAPIMAGAKAIDIEREAQKYQRSGLSNRAVVDGLLTLEGIKDRKKFEQARDTIAEQNQGAGNARNLMILGNNARYTQLALSPAEMDFIDSRKMSREEICALMKTPPPVVGIYENATLANIETARKIFWVDSVIPLLSQIEDALNIHLAPEFGDDLRAAYDVSQVEALWPIFKEKIEAAERLFKMGVPFDEINRRLELKFGRLPHGKQGFIPGNMVPASVGLVDDLNDVE